MVHLRRSGCQRSANLCPQLKINRTGLSREAIKKVGWRAFVQATVLWVTVAAASLGVIYWGVV